MAERRLPIPERPWHKSKSGRWSLSLGVRGLKVRVQQHKPGGTFQRVFRVGRRVTYASLGTTDRREARRLAIDFIREVEQGKKINLAEPLTLEKLWDRYQQEASSYRGNLERTRRQKQTDARLLVAGLGATKRIEHLTKNDVERYVAMRRTGHGWPDGRETIPVRARTIQGEIKMLRQMIYWAMNERLPDGSWLLENNPLRGVKLPKEEDPRRPVATYDRFLKLREAAQDMAATAPQQRGRDRWKRWELALVLAEATGARIGAISGLRWSDISLEPPEIKFRAEFDKRGRDRVVPIPEALADELRGFKVKFAAVGDGWLFPCADKDESLAAGDPRRAVRPRGAACGSAASERRSLPSVQEKVGHRAKEHVARGRDGGRRVARRADAAQLLPAGDDGRHARGDEHACEASRQESQQQVMRRGFRRGSGVNACKTLAGPKNTKSATPLIAASRFELPLLGSNQDSPDPESGVLPITPRGIASCKEQWS